MKTAVFKTKQLFHCEQYSFIFTSEHLALQAVAESKVLLSRVRPPGVYQKRSCPAALTFRRCCHLRSGEAAAGTVPSAQWRHCLQHKNVCCALQMYFSGN